MKRPSPRRREKVAFDAPVLTPTGGGGTKRDWAPAENAYVARAEFIYAGGDETLQASRLAQKAAFKVRIRQSVAARAITADMRMRDTRRNVEYNIREFDAVTDRRWVWLKVESGVVV